MRHSFEGKVKGISLSTYRFRDGLRRPDPASGRLRKATRRSSQTGPHIEYVGILAHIKKLDEFPGRRGPAKVELV